MILKPQECTVQKLKNLFVVLLINDSKENELHLFFIKSWNLNSSTCPLYFFIVNLSRGTHIIYNSILFFGSKGGQISVLNKGRPQLKNPEIFQSPSPLFGKGPYQRKVGISYLIIIIKFGFFRVSNPSPPTSSESRTSPILSIEVAPQQTR